MAADGSDGPGEGAAAGGEIWGTLEELVLACAVSRHGTASWESVAMEVKTRSPLAARPGLTPHSCRLRFRHLHRRFSAAGGTGEDEPAEEMELDASAADGWVDELRRLRVAELRREVERCDLSIGTLQTKVKLLREERERGLSGEAKPEGLFAGDDRLSGEEPGRSCRESNSTDLKPPAHPGDHAAVKDEQILKHEASGESVAASKESSDVRSSVSLCRRRKLASGADDDEETASAPRPPAQSQPLAALLDTIATRFGSVFERLHESQESEEYRGTIRRHVDLEMVRRRLEGPGASGYPAREFYRDVLLLCTNAVVFFSRPGPERDAAAAARALVCASLREPRRERGGDAPAAARRAEAGAADIVGPLIEKAGKPLIVCRKRSSIAKAAAAAAVKEEAAPKDGADEDDEQSSDGKKAVPAAAAAAKDKAWGLRTKKSRGLALNGAVNRKPGKAVDAAASAAEGAKKGGAAVDGVAKKRNAKDFLKRLNQGSSPSKKRGSPLGTRKRAVAAAADQQKARRGPGRKEGGRGGSKMGPRAAATAKRGVGRPLKRGAAPTTTTPPPSKRARVGRSEKAPSAKRGGRK